MPQDILKLIASLERAEHSPCASIYMETHPTYPANQQDTIRYGNQIRAVAEQLDLEKSAKSDFMEPLLALRDDQSLWTNADRALAVFRSPSRFEHITLDAPVQQLAKVAPYFHLRPLRHLAQQNQPYHLLALSRDTATLYHGNRYHLAPLETPGTLTPSLDEALTTDYLVAPPIRELRGVRTQHEERQALIDRETEAYFRVIDKLISVGLGASKNPLILAALPEHQGVFRGLSKNDNLIEESISVDPKSLSLAELRDRAWDICHRQVNQRIDALIATFQKEQASGRASDNLETVAKHATTGNIRDLLIGAGEQVAGQVDCMTGSVETIERGRHPTGNDLLDDISRMVQVNGGSIHIIAPSQMPSDQPLAATFYRNTSA